MKRLVDVALAFAGLVAASPVLAIMMFLVWLQDRHSPLYTPERVGKDGRLFRMVKLRSMIANADRTGVSSTSGDDRRITVVGHVIRKYKLDELAQLWNVIAGDMSLVGPRPNLERETRSYTSEEARLLSVRPGITDFSSIVFADEGEILRGVSDPDLSYDQLIRPWKSRLGIFYVERRSVMLDLQLIFLTALAIVNRRAALAGVSALLRRLDAPEILVKVARREDDLAPAPPPGATQIITSRG